MSNSDRKRKRVDDATSSNSQPSIQQPIPPESGQHFDAGVLFDDVLSQMKTLDGYVATLGKDVLQNIVATLEKAKVHAQRKQIQYDEIESNDDADIRLLVDEYVPKVRQGQFDNILEKRRLRRLATHELTGNQSSTGELIVGGSVDGEAGSLELPSEEHSDICRDVLVNEGVEGISVSGKLFEVGNEFSESVGGEKELEPEMDVDPPEHREIPLLSLDSANSAAIVSNPDKQTAKDIQTDEPAHATECDRDGVCDEPKTEQSDDYGIFEQAEFGSEDVEMQIESHQSVENGGKSSVNIEQPEHHDDPLPRVDSADPSTSISKPDEESKPEKDIHTNELILDPDYARGGNSDEQTTEQLDEHELSEDTGSDSDDIDDLYFDRAPHFATMDAESEKSAKEDSDGEESSVTDESVHGLKCIQNCDKDRPKTEQSCDRRDSDEEESLVDLAIVSQPDKETNPEKDTLSVEDVDRLKLLSHGELIRRIINSKDCLNSPAFTTLMKKEEHRLLKIVFDANGTVKLEVSKENRRDSSKRHYINLKTCMIPQWTVKQCVDFVNQLVALISILLQVYDVSEAYFFFQTLYFVCTLPPFETYFKASSDKIPVRFLNLGQNTLLAPLLQFVRPKSLHIGFPCDSLFDKNGNLMISDINELHLNSDTDDRVDRVMEECQARHIYLSKKSIWSDTSIKKVLTAHAGKPIAKWRTIRGNCSKAPNRSLRKDAWWTYLLEKWLSSCVKTHPSYCVARIKLLEETSDNSIRLQLNA